MSSKVRTQPLWWTPLETIGPSVNHFTPSDAAVAQPSFHRRLPLNLTDGQIWTRIGHNPPTPPDSTSAPSFPEPQWGMRIGGQVDIKRSDGTTDASPNVLSVSYERKPVGFPLVAAVHCVRMSMHPGRHCRESSCCYRQRF